MPVARNTRPGPAQARAENSMPRGSRGNEVPGRNEGAGPGPKRPGAIIGLDRSTSADPSWCPVSILTPRMSSSALSRRLSSSDAVSPRFVVSPALAMPRMSPGCARSLTAGAMSSSSRSWSRSVSHAVALVRDHPFVLGPGAHAVVRPPHHFLAGDQRTASRPGGRARNDRARPCGRVPPAWRRVVVGPAKVSTPVGRLTPLERHTPSS